MGSFFYLKFDFLGITFERFFSNNKDKICYLKTEFFTSDLCFCSEVI